MSKMLEQHNNCAAMTDHQEFNFRGSGLIIDTDDPFLVRSPDGIA